MSGQCAAGYKLPSMDRPCTKCGATSREPCPEALAMQEDEIARLRDALEHVRSIIAEAALTGFNYKDGDWAERLFASQQITSAALKTAQGKPE